MKGLITVEDGFDVTKPFDDEAWDKGYLGSKAIANERSADCSCSTHVR